jgi:CIC family chloride channel protein
MEVLLPSFALELFGPIIICSVISTTIAHAVFGSAPVYSIPKYAILSHWELLLDMGLGVFLGLVSVVFIRVFSGAHLLFGWLKPIRHAKPVVAMLILGLVGIPYFDLFGNGYDTVNLVLNGEHVGPLQILVLLAVLKILVTALCRAGGIPGGLFTPSLFIGALLGNCFGMVAHHLFSSCRLSDPAAFALVGMGAIVAGTLQSPVTAILLIFEMTREYALILPLMSACILSALVSRWFQKGSLFTEPLRRGGIVLPRSSAPTWLRQPVVRAFLSADVATVSPAERFQRLTETFLRAPEGQDELYVTDSEGTCLGVISLHDIKRFIRETDHLESVIAADILNTSFPFVFAEDPVARAIELLAESDRERLPVLESPVRRKLLGTVSKRKLLWDYSETSLARERLTKDDGP